MSSPKHKIFFGVSDGKPPGKTLDEYLAGKDPNYIPGAIPGADGEPCWLWDTSEAVFSSESLRFDCDYDGYVLSELIFKSAGFTFDNEVVTMDTDTKIYN